jgi:hypothetical protein
MRNWHAPCFQSGTASPRGAPDRKKGMGQKHMGQMSDTLFGIQGAAL